MTIISKKGTTSEEKKALQEAIKIIKKEKSSDSDLKIIDLLLKALGLGIKYFDT